MNLDVIDAAAVERFVRRFRNFLPQPGSGRGLVENLQDALRDWQANLHGAWRQPLTLGREVALLRVISAHLTPPEAQAITDAYTMVLLHALHVADRMRICQNHECGAPYFLAERRSQKYCSEPCARPAQAEFKARWWSAHGNEWQQKRRARAKRQKTKSHKGGN
jgi:hypothetical protein